MKIKIYKTISTLLAIIVGLMAGIHDLEMIGICI